MGFFHFIRDFYSSLILPWHPNPIADALGFSVCEAGRIRDRCSWEDIVEIIAYKCDHGCYDEICLRIGVAGRDHPIVVSEEFGDYGQFVAAFESRLTSVTESWWRRVAFPAFAENATVVYARNSLA